MNAMKNIAEEIRIRYLYRRMIVTGKLALSLPSARALVGPDCAYHLYGVMNVKKKRARNIRNHRPAVFRNGLL